MKVAIHQPNYLPYLGYFDKIRQADIFVFLDDAQFSKGSYTNRNRIKTSNGIKWITVPLLKRKRKLPINRMIVQSPLLPSSLWIIKHSYIIHNSYRNAEYFDLISAVINDIFEENWLYLAN